MHRSRLTSFASGMRLANSLPHLATMISGRRHLTPLGGRDSGPLLNGLWAALNIGGGIALLYPARRRGTRRWDHDLNAFELGAATFAAWMAASEVIFRTNASGRPVGNIDYQSGQTHPDRGSRTDW
jgi:hypothetical protein